MPFVGTSQAAPTADSHRGWLNKLASVADPNNKIQDPTEKLGLIGAFCRTYDIEEAIAEFLSDIYVPGNDAGTDFRYC